jgi:hypothetical protein
VAEGLTVVKAAPSVLPSTLSVCVLPGTTTPVFSTIAR